MAWVKIDDQFPDHPKARAVGAHGRGVFLEALCYANRLLTDGFVPAEIAKRISVEHAGRGHAQEVIARLVAVGLWERDGARDGFVIHDYLDYQPSKEKVKADRASNARRQALFQDSDLKVAIRERDGDNCRYCGVIVGWTDRRGRHGGTYDHIDPRGGNSIENLVVACRACNAAKSQRTPAAARMVLLPVPNQKITSYKPVNNKLPVPVPVPVPLGASHEAPATETAADARHRIDRQVYALVDAFAEGKGLARSDLAGAARKTAFNALAEAPTWVSAGDVRACTAYLMTDLFWSQPGKLKAKVVVETLPEWRNKGRPVRTKLHGIAGGQTADLEHDQYTGENYLRVKGNTNG